MVSLDQITQLGSKFLKYISVNNDIVKQISIFTLISVLFLYCSDKKDPVMSGDKDVGISIITPEGNELLPAEEGPIRSSLGEPEIDINTFNLQITGLVDSSFSLNWSEIQEWPTAYTDTLIMYCVEGWEVWGNWKGILIKDLLEIANMQSEGEYILFESAEGYKSILSISYLEKYDAMLAYEVNDAPLKKHDGFPLRLIAFGKFGYKWSKWVNKMEIMSLVQIADSSLQEYADPADVPIERRKLYEGEDVEPLDY